MESEILSKVGTHNQSESLLEISNQIFKNFIETDKEGSILLEYQIDVEK